MYSRVQPRSGILHLLNQPGHVLEEDVVQLLLLHVLQLEHGPVLGAPHGGGEEVGGGVGTPEATEATEGVASSSTVTRLDGRLEERQVGGGATI